MGRNVTIKTFASQGAVIIGLCFGGSYAAQKNMANPQAAERRDSFERAAGIIESRMGEIRSCKRELQAGGQGSENRLITCIDHKRAIGEIRRTLRDSAEPQIRAAVNELPAFARTPEQVDQIVENLKERMDAYRQRSQEIREDLSVRDRKLLDTRNALKLAGKFTALITIICALAGGISSKKEEDIKYN